MKASELLRRLKRLAHRRGWSYEWRPDLGKGSHGRLEVNGRRTIVPYLRAELRFAVDHEAALDADDLVDRRTRIGLVPSERAAAQPVAAAILDTATARFRAPG